MLPQSPEATAPYGRVSYADLSRGSQGNAAENFIKAEGEIPWLPREGGWPAGQGGVDTP